jgi:hypothetical protein
LLGHPLNVSFAVPCSASLVVITVRGAGAGAGAGVSAGVGAGVLLVGVLGPRGLGRGATSGVGLP